MESSMKYYSDMEKYEIININDGDRYSFLGNNDIIIDNEGNLKLLVLNNNKSRFTFFSRNDYNEISWDSIKKIGSKTIIIDVDNNIY
ncbi:sporulation protein, YlmC/YmxH family [Clostridium collagenovorans DSM 3089]|uniref:Sporulation protein, YlmC/YmxH family n=1 Tax=Clostridium collagenovorans DSM 3089 TaxID=1121306 RepID=A0A1M5SX10_9CLOT|nr:YlmC/YmxH family sporulation protein [Clostridium collagenovorans]SHH42995.1 sporulation protein, YlmC/YmxH family [Clostridium collagenovorans DSM 3089]